MNPSVRDRFLVSWPGTRHDYPFAHRISLSVQVIPIVEKLPAEAGFVRSTNQKTRPRCQFTILQSFNFTTLRSDTIRRGTASIAKDSCPCSAHFIEWGSENVNEDVTFRCVVRRTMLFDWLCKCHLDEILLSKKMRGLYWPCLDLFLQNCQLPNIIVIF